MPASTSYGREQDRHETMRDTLHGGGHAQDVAARQIDELRHMVWCNAAKLNDQHRARIGAGLRDLGVRR
jgi:hypothetical protein